MPFTGEQHPVSDLGPGGEHEPFRIGHRCERVFRTRYQSARGGILPQACVISCHSVRPARASEAGFIAAQNATGPRRGLRQVRGNANPDT